MTTTREAVAVLVTRGHRILGFRRYDESGIALPCGKREENESLEEAAIRECEEETGHKVKLRPDAPYCGFDTVGGFMVTTYRADILETHEPTTPHEGSPIWVSARTLTEGPFGHYNERMLRHFKINPWPLVGKFHSHLTIRGHEVERAAKLVGGKATCIDLSRHTEQRQQTDMMITNHYVTGMRGLEDEYDVIALLESKAYHLRSCGIEVVRVKLEYDVFGKTSPRGDANRALERRPYTEIHIKIGLTESCRNAVLQQAREFGWHPSRNLFSVSSEGQCTQFINRRYYVSDVETTSWEKIDSDIDTLIQSLIPLEVEVKEIKYETAIYDSNEDLDRWWVRPT